MLHRSYNINRWTDPTKYKVFVEKLQLYLKIIIKKTLLVLFLENSFKQRFKSRQMK